MPGVAREGSGTPCLVPVPALPSPQQRELPRSLRDHLELIFVDAHSGDPVTALDEARLDAGHARAGVLGTSVWGLLAASYAQRMPQHAAFVVVVGTPPHAGSLDDAQRDYWQQHASSARKRLLEERLRDLDDSGEDDDLVRNARAWAPMGWFDTAFDPGPLLEGIEIDHERTATTVRSFSSTSLPAVLPRLCCPVLRVHGAHDYIVPPSLWEPHADLGENVRERIFARSAHHPCFEEPEHFAEELLGFVAETALTP